MADYFNSIQQATITIAGGAVSGTATLSPSVTAANAIVFPGYFHVPDAGTNPATTYSRITLTNGTTLTADRNTSSANAVGFLATILDATSSLVVGVQYGTITIANGTSSNTATITAVGTLANSTVHILGQTTDNTTSNTSNHQAELDLTNTTTVTATRNGTTNAVTVSFCVVEWQGAVIQSIQKMHPTLNSSSLTDNETISAVTMANSIILFAGVTSSGTTHSGCLEALQLTTTTNVQFKRESTALGNHTVRYTVVEFVPGILTSMQRGTTQLTTTSTTATISSVTTSKALLNSTGLASAGTTFARIWSDIALTNSTTITIARDGTTNNNDMGWEVFEIFVSAPPSGAMKGKDFMAFFGM